MRRQEQDQLLKEILAGEDLSHFRQASLQSGLTAVRHRRRRHRVFRVSAVTLLPLFLAYAIFVWQRSRESRPTTSSSSLAQISDAVSANAKPEVKIITDDELFELFPGRSMALIGKPGEQQLVFLNRLAQDY